MKYPKYPVIVSNDHLMYLFWSEGPKGKISKGIIYSKIQGNLYNLSFGDWNENLQQLDDSTRSNNGDREKVLATVASTAVDFIDKFPDAQIFIEGSTSARTRLYQMGIGGNILEINETFEVKGYQKDDWHPFRTGDNYEAFLIKRK
jgi:hypothetical protein